MGRAYKLIKSNVSRDEFTNYIRNNAGEYLLDGDSLIEVRPTSEKHLAVVKKLKGLIQSYLETHETNFKFKVPKTFDLNEQNNRVVYPDIMLISEDENREEKNILFVDVWSSSNHTRSECYGSDHLFEVEESWSINIKDNSWFSQRRSTERTGESLSATAGIAVSEVLPGLEFNVRELLESTENLMDANLFENQSDFVNNFVSLDRRLTLEDYVKNLSFLEGSRGCEFINGVVYAEPALPHGAYKFSQIFEDVSKEYFGKDCRLESVRVYLHLTEDDPNIYSPTVTVYAQKVDVLRFLYYGCVPDILFQAWAFNHYQQERDLKINRFKEAGVKEIWTLDFNKQKVTVYSLDESKGKYAEVSYPALSKIESKVFSGLVIDFSEIELTRDDFKYNQ